MASKLKAVVQTRAAGGVLLLSFSCLVCHYLIFAGSVPEKLCLLTAVPHCQEGANCWEEPEFQPQGCSPSCPFPWQQYWQSAMFWVLCPETAWAREDFCLSQTWDFQVEQRLPQWQDAMLSLWGCGSGSDTCHTGLGLSPWHCCSGYLKPFHSWILRMGGCMQSCREGGLFLQGSWRRPTGQTPKTLCWTAVSRALPWTPWLIVVLEPSQLCNVAALLRESRGPKARPQVHRKSQVGRDPTRIPGSTQDHPKKIEPCIWEHWCAPRRHRHMGKMVGIRQGICGIWIQHLHLLLEALWKHRAGGCWRATGGSKAGAGACASAWPRSLFLPSLLAQQGCSAHHLKGCRNVFWVFCWAYIWEKKMGKKWGLFMDTEDSLRHHHWL